MRDGDPERSASRRPSAPAAIGCVVAAIVIVLWSRRWWGSLYDDSYIFFRYADHVVEGCGLRFNCGGPRVEGFSSPLYLALLSAARLVTRDLERASLVIGTLSMIAAVALATLAVDLWARKNPRALSPTLAAWSPLLTAAASASSAHLVFHAVVGMDAALGAAVISGVLYCAIAGRYLRLACCVACLARPEAFVFVLALPLVKEERSARRLWPIAAFVVGIVVLRLALFGAVTPNTYAAKAGWTAQHASYGARYLLESFAAHPAVLLAPLAIGVGSSRLRFFLVGAASWLLGVVPSGGDFYPLGRLVVPLVPALAAVGVLGAARLLRGNWAERLGIALACAAMCVDLRRGVRALPEVHGFELVLHWRALGEHFRARRPDALVAVAPSGALPYAFRGRTIDILGLNDPAIARSGASVPPERMKRAWVGHERHDLRYLLAAKPDLFVLMAWRSEPWVLEDASGGVYAEQEIVAAIQRHEAPYHVVDLELRPGVHQLVFARDPE